jgi:hypothetical protein
MEAQCASHAPHAPEARTRGYSVNASGAEWRKFGTYTNVKALACRSEGTFGKLGDW